MLVSKSNRYLDRLLISSSRTTDEKFLPKPVQPKAIFHSLVDLLNNVKEKTLKSSSSNQPCLFID
jgi:hypothetical protein